MKGCIFVGTKMKKMKNKTNPTKSKSHKKIACRYKKHTILDTWRVLGYDKILLYNVIHKLKIGESLEINKNDWPLKTTAYHYYYSRNMLGAIAVVDKGLSWLIVKEAKL